ncbi:hypothetical protein Tco_0219295, partial [Tanacetum coccineum]
MVRIGAVPKPPYDDEDTEHPRKKSKNSTSDRTEGPSEPHGPPIGLVFWELYSIRWLMPPKAMSENKLATSMAKFMANMNRGAGGDKAGCARAGGARADGARVSSAGAGGVGAAGGVGVGASGAGAGGAGAGGAGAGGAGAGGAKAGG